MTTFDCKCYYDGCDSTDINRTRFSLRKVIAVVFVAIFGSSQDLSSNKTLCHVHQRLYSLTLNNSDISSCFSNVQGNRHVDCENPQIWWCSKTVHAVLTAPYLEGALLALLEREFCLASQPTLHNHDT